MSQSLAGRTNGYLGMIQEEADFAGLDRALALAVIEDESGFQNIFGHDHAWAAEQGDEPPYYGHDVTAARVRALLNSPWENGVGLPQLTYTPFLKRAEFLGGAHEPRFQCRVAFDVLMQLLAQYSYHKALASYNAGEGNWTAGIDYANKVAASHEEWTQLLNGQTNGNGVKMPTGLDIVNAAYEVLGAPYRVWYEGMSIPTWLDDEAGDPPSVEHLMWYGLECADLVDYALERNGLPSGGGTLSFADYLVEQEYFDPSTPGEPGAIAYKPYAGPALADQGHLAIFVDEHTIIQALGLHGVTDAFTDTETFYWGGSTEFTIYGKLPGVDYSGETSSVTVPEGSWYARNEQGVLILDGEDCTNGWYELPSWKYVGRRWTQDKGYF